MWGESVKFGDDSGRAHVSIGYLPANWKPLIHSPPSPGGGAKLSRNKFFVGVKRGAIPSPAGQGNRI
jgi:hypothetical protein